MVLSPRKTKQLEKQRGKYWLNCDVHKQYKLFIPISLLGDSNL